MSSRLRLDRVLKKKKKRCLVCADLHRFFFPIIFPPGLLPAPEAAMGTSGRPGESLGGLTHCDCWLGHTIVKVGHASWLRVATTSCLINTVQFGIVQLSECCINLSLPRLELWFWSHPYPLIYTLKVWTAHIKYCWSFKVYSHPQMTICCCSDFG